MQPSLLFHLFAPAQGAPPEADPGAGLPEAAASFSDILDGLYVLPAGTAETPPALPHVSDGGPARAVEPRPAPALPAPQPLPQRSHPALQHVPVQGRPEAAPVAATAAPPEAAFAAPPPHEVAPPPPAPEQPVPPERSGRDPAQPHRAPETAPPSRTSSMPEEGQPRTQVLAFPAPQRTTTRPAEPGLHDGLPVPDASSTSAETASPEQAQGSDETSSIRMRRPVSAPVTASPPLSEAGGTSAPAESPSGHHSRPDHGGQGDPQAHAEPHAQAPPAKPAAERPSQPEGLHALPEAASPEQEGPAATCREDVNLGAELTSQEQEVPAPAADPGSRGGAEEASSREGSPSSRTLPRLPRGPEAAAAWIRAMLSRHEPRLAKADGWKMLSVNLEEGGGTVTIQARREEDKVAIRVAFSDPGLRALAQVHADRIQEALQAGYEAAVDLSLSSGSDRRGPQEEPPRPAGDKREGPAPPAEAERAAPGRRIRASARGARHEWIG